MKRGVVLLTGVLAVCGVASAAANPGAAPATAKAAAQKLAATDGQPRVVERRGKFVIKPDTLFCGIQAKIDPAYKGMNVGPFGSNYTSLINENLAKIGQSSSFGTDKRIRNEADCTKARNPIYITGLLEKNTTNTPYRLELSARQGAAAGAGSAFVKVVVERADGFRDDAKPLFMDCSPPPVNKCPSERDYALARYTMSIKSDAQDIAKIIISHVFSREGK